MNKGRKTTGGKYHANRKKKHFEQPGHERQITLRETKKKQIRTRSGHRKTVLLAANKVNLTISTGKTKVADIVNVIETPQNTFLARQNRLMKGAIIMTSVGRAKITNRPTQEGAINAILIEE
jgi:small subunit ribosomal protein S8e